MGRGNWWDDVDKKMLDTLERDGIEAFLELGVAMLEVPPGNFKPEMKTKFVGEVCEVIFWGLTNEYLRLTEKRDVRVFHSVILKDLRNPKSSFRTECDFILVTPELLLTTECKSYAGQIEIKAPCTLVGGSREVDVYAQSKLHRDKLLLYAEQMVIPNSSVSSLPVGANVFCFSNSIIRDLRSDTERRRLQITTASSLLCYYQKLFAKERVPVYDYAKACKVFEACSTSEALHLQHQNYLGYTK